MRTPTPRAAALLAVVALGLASLLADLGTLHRLEHGDSLVPVLVSLQRLTPFYWDQERYGMLVPLLAWPVRAPLGNLLLQRWLLALAGLGAVLLLARKAAPGRAALPCGLLAAALVVALAPAPFLFEYLADQPYGLGLLLGLAGLALAEPRPGAEGGSGAGRLALAAALVALAHWVNAATGLFLGPVVVAAAAASRAGGLPAGAVRRSLVLELGLVAGGLAAGQGLLRLYPVLSGHPLRLDLSSLPAAGWPGAWATLLANGAAGVGWPLAATLGVVAVAGIALGWLLPGRGEEGAAPRGGERAVRAAALVAAALAYALWNGTLRWVSLNAFHWRYLAPSVLLLAVVATAPLARSLARARWSGVTAAALVPAAALLAYGPPSLAGVRADLDQRLGRWTEDVLAARCDLVAGDYWSVWPAVWHSGWVAHQRGLPGPYGITHRSNPTVPLWSGRPREALRICRVRGAEAAADGWLHAFHVWPVRVIEQRATVDVLAIAPELPDVPPSPQPAQAGPVRSAAGPVP